MAKKLPAVQETGFNPWVRKMPQRREWQSTPIFLPGEFREQRSLMGYSSWSCKEFDMTEWLTFSFCGLVKHNCAVCYHCLHFLFAFLFFVITWYVWFLTFISYMIYLKHKKHQVALLSFIKIQFMNKDVITWKKSRLVLIYLQKCNSKKKMQFIFFLAPLWVNWKKKKRTRLSWQFKIAHKYIINRGEICLVCMKREKRQLLILFWDKVWW